MCQKMNKDKTLYKIISGRTNIMLDGSFFVISEPANDLICESYAIYEEVYDRAYGDGSFIEEELKAYLVEQDIWTPTHDKEITALNNDLDNKKVEAYDNYFRKDLYKIKRQARNIEKQISDMYSIKNKFNFLECHNIAEAARQEWLLTQVVSPIELVIDNYFLFQKVCGQYYQKMIPVGDIRDCSRLDSWRAIWSNNKIHGGRLFNKDPIDFTRDQLSLCSFTQMYDSVYENSDRPNDKIIEDNDCLDGWFIVQRRKAEADKKISESGTKNSKIANAKERFIMVDNEEDARAVMNMNDATGKAILNSRFKTLQTVSGPVKDEEFADVKMGLM